MGVNDLTNILKHQPAKVHLSSKSLISECCSWFPYYLSIPSHLHTMVQFKQIL